MRSTLVTKFGVDVKPSSLKLSSSGGVADILIDPVWLCESASDVSTDDRFSLVLGCEYVSLAFADV